jgi:hypothetical protein
MPSEFPDEIKIDEIQRPGRLKPGVGETLFERTGQGESEVARFLARWLDNILRIPGTDFKIGLDPILSLFPGVGSTIASGGGLIILAEAVRSGVSVPVLVRMGGNMLLNTLFDYLPLAGPVASAFFKSNVRNLRLLQKWQAGHQEAVRRGTCLLFLAFGGILALLGLVLFGLFIAYIYVLRTVFGVGAN